jgi:hypothetical protein
MPANDSVFRGDARGENHEGTDRINLTCKRLVVLNTTDSTDESDHISQEKLLQSLAHQLVLTVNERWHLSGCDRCNRTRDVLRKLRDARLGADRL